MAGYGAMPEATGPAFTGKVVGAEPEEIRAGFITKVYGILSAQLLLTAAVAAPFVFSHGVRLWVKTQGLPLIIAATLANLVFLCALVCPCGCERNLRTFPQNYLFLAGFTATEGVLVGVVCASYALDAVALAVLATAVLVGGLTAYAMYTKRDFTGMGPYLFAAVLVLMIFGIFAALTQFPMVQKIYCCLGILIFSFYLIFDTQMIMGRGELALGVDDYVFAALQLYIDIIQLFLYILELVGRR
mmetsp:Transcript_39990/g.113080  ORF Transcript_39990/g.113080 Transcript_39990/m.113080 type:complete len:244 (-) Transcript_39990:179-910(-)